MADKVLSYGEKKVGLNFNPNNNPEVQAIKERAAKTIDELREKQLATSSPEEQEIFTEAINHAITAQMWAVKAITYTQK